jgi:hypothetical protein
VGKQIINSPWVLKTAQNERESSKIIVFDPFNSQS